jgi:hypothetical protein
MNWTDIKNPLIRHKTLIATAILLTLAMTGIIQKGSSQIGRQLTQSNDQFLDGSIKSTVQLMIPIGIAKGAADVIEGSTTVVEWGDIAQPILEYLDVAWRILLLSLITSTATKYILLGAAPLANALLVISFGFYFVFSIMRYWSATLAILCVTFKRIAALCLLGYLLFVAILPLTIFGTSRLAHSITEPLRAQTFQSFSAWGRVFSLDDITKQTGFIAKVDAVKGKAEEIIRFCGSATVDIASSVAKLAVVKVLEGVIFPLGALAFLIWLVRGTLYPALGLSDRSLARRDLNRIEDFLKRGQPSRKAEEKD